MQLGGLQAKTGIDSTEQQDGENNGKVSHQGPDLQRGKEEASVSSGLLKTQSLGGNGENGQGLCSEVSRPGSATSGVSTIFPSLSFPSCKMQVMIAPTLEAQVEGGSLENLGDFGQSGSSC